DNAMLSKWAGGLGNDWTPVRALNSYIKGTNGKSQGVVPFLKVANDTAVAVNQGGKRKGAVCAYLETWHLDIEEFLELRKNTGDDRRRTHDMNTANWVPDLFMQRVFEDAEWTLFTPSETPDLHDLMGVEFAERYAYYEGIAKETNMLHKVIRAKDLWRKMLSMLFETGHPWITFKDVCNLRSPQQHVGVVHSSNLCTEITLNTNEDEIAVCNLGSINLVQHVKGGVLDREKLARTVKTAVRMLDNVIDINYYAVPQARTSNLKHRPVGMGIMGFQDALYEMNLAYGSDAAVEFADESMEVISYYAISTSSDLAVERGTYETFKGSLWDQGILPIDSLDLVAKSRPERMFEVDRTQRLDWDTLRNKVQKDGMRNSNVMAIAPTATISNICGVSQSIEPTFQNLYVKSNLSGEFTVINPYLVRALKDRGLWDSVMVNDLKHFEGSVQKIARIPEELKAIFATAFEVEPRWIVDAASRRQKWIDQAQSLNLYISGANGKKLDMTYKMAWLRGLKTTYYLRALGATSAEKSTINTGALNAVKSNMGAPVVTSAPVAEVAKKPEAIVEDDFAQAAPVPMACSIDNPDCEACQ
ncbi:ribonucleoside-diphosphate reductase subunit alpha, partial [Acinetobacter sp.]